MPCATKCGIASAVLAVVLIVGGSCVYTLLPGVIRQQISDDLVLDSPTSSSFNSFANSSSKISIYQSFYIFHLENAYAVVNEGAIPQLVQKGPYNYLTTQWRDIGNISWKANATIYYTYHETYEFEPSLSQGNLESDVITTVNLGLIGAYYQSRFNPDQFELVKIMADLGQTPMFINLTVRELLWGYNNTFLAALGQNPFLSLFTNDDPSTFSAPSAAYTGGQAASGLPQPPPNSHFQMTMWEGMSELPYWGSSYANMINGTDGTSFHPGIDCSETPYVFVDTLYRSCTMVCAGDETYSGVALIRFVLSPNDTLSAEENPNNAAFYMYETGFLSTPPAGNVPMTFSKPLYLDANLSRVLVNITPPLVAADRDLYETYLDAEPHTGLLFRVHKRIQLNTFLNSSYFSNPSQVQTWFPILWADENMEMPDKLVNDFKKDVMLPLHLVQYGGITATAVGGVLALVSIVLLVRAVCVARKGTSELDVYAPLNTTVSNGSELTSEKLRRYQ